jgi:sodium--glutamate symport carrier gltS
LTIFGNGQYFIAGFLLADFYLNQKPRKRKNDYSYDLIGVIAMSILPYAKQFKLLVLFLPWIIPTLYWCVFSGILLRKIFSSKMIRTIGGMCYSIYLIHNPIISIIGGLSTQFHLTNYYSLNLLIQTMIILPVIAIASLIYFIIIEKPCMNKDWPQQFIGYIKNGSTKQKMV